MFDPAQLTSDGLSALLPLKSLAVLCLEGCLAVNDDAAPHLAALTALTELDLGACDEVTDQVRPANRFPAGFAEFLAPSTAPPPHTAKILDLFFCQI